MHRHDEALQDFNRAIQLDPNDKWALAHRGAIYRFMRLYQESLQDLSRAIQLDPNYLWAIASRGDTYRCMQRYNEALQDFNRVIELDANFQWRPATGFRDFTHQQMQRYYEPPQDLDPAIVLNRNYQDDWYLYERALTYLALNQPDKAQADLALAMKLAKEHYAKDPQNWRNSFNLALYYLAAEYNQPAEQLYRHTLSQGASFDIRIAIKVAIQDLNDFLTVFPNHVQATSMRQLLQSSLTEVM